MKTKQVTALTGLTKDTLRFYEKEQLIPAPVRDRNGYRNYPDKVVEQLQMIALAKTLGFTLQEIRELSQLLYAQHLTPKTMAAKLTAKSSEIENKINELTRMKQLIDDSLAGLCEFRHQLNR